MIKNFRIAAGDEKGTYYGRVFQDSDLAKWLEAVAYSLTVEANPELEARADAIIDLIGRAQQPDGYLDTYFIAAEPEHKWQNLTDCHEMYCAGRIIRRRERRSFYISAASCAIISIGGSDGKQAK